MGEPMTPLERLGKEIARAEDAALGPVIEQARERFEQSSRESAAVRRSRVRAFTLVPAIAAAILAVAVLVFYRQEPRPLTFELDASRRGLVKEWVLASAERDVPLRFSDGTTVLLERGSQGRVDELTARGASVRIERGRAAVSVPPGKGAEFRFDTGPFEVFVTGTRFDVSWDAKHQIFELAMQDGSVKVRGPTLVSDRVVVAGQTLRIPLAHGEDGEDDERDEGEDATADAGALVAPDASPLARNANASPSASPSAGASHNPVASHEGASAAKTWRDLAAEGTYTEALAAATPQYDAICARGSSADVVALADTARYAGDGARAQKAYNAVRTRFAGSRDAATAAFELGRMAFQGGDDGAAVQWFETYSRESPDGPLAREALGRLMEAFVRRHDDASARRIADQYLRAYPSGPHAKLARSLVDR